MDKNAPAIMKSAMLSQVGDDQGSVMLTISAIVGAVAVVMVRVILVVGPERIWRLFGPPDLDSIEFETLERRNTPNDALACPPHLCKAERDFTPAHFVVDATALRAAMAKVIATEPRLSLVESDDATLTDRHIRRSALLKFPDMIIVRYIKKPEKRSTLAIYSRSQLGHSDLGINLAL
ncbi:MAG: DUF1499 domain-containing protein [Methyloceanibacter sp.]|jgi:uncharacterized protein (DUF1499 family)